MAPGGSDSGWWSSERAHGRLSSHSPSAFAPDRARAGEAELSALRTKLDQVVLGTSNGGADSPGACPQRSHPSRFEISQAALVGGRRREADDGGLVERLRQLPWHALRGYAANRRGGAKAGRHPRQVDSDPRLVQADDQPTPASGPDQEVHRVGQRPTPRALRAELDE